MLISAGTIRRFGPSCSRIVYLFAAWLCRMALPHGLRARVLIISSRPFAPHRVHLLPIHSLPTLSTCVASAHVRPRHPTVHAANIDYPQATPALITWSVSSFMKSCCWLL